MGRDDVSPIVELPEDAVATRGSRRDVVRAGVVVAGGVAAVYIKPSLTRIRIPTALAASGGPQGQTGDDGGSDLGIVPNSVVITGVSVGATEWTVTGTFQVVCDHDDTITSLSAVVYALDLSGADLGEIGSASATGFSPSTGTPCGANESVKIGFTATFTKLVPKGSVKFQLVLSVTTSAGSATNTYNW